MKSPNRLAGMPALLAPAPSVLRVRIRRSQMRVASAC